MHHPDRWVSSDVDDAIRPNDWVEATVVSSELRALFGDIDIYLFDQLLRGRLDNRKRVLDAGCGEGRNLVYLLHRGYECFGVDRDPSCISLVRDLADRTMANLPKDNFQVADLDALPFADRSMDVVIASAVLHFARDVEHWSSMVDELWRVLAPGGLFFTRLASNIGIEVFVPRAGRRTRLPDGTDRFVVDEDLLLATTTRFGARLVDPIKTTNVQQDRCMTTWVLEKR